MWKRKRAFAGSMLSRYETEKNCCKGHIQDQIKSTNSRFLKSSKQTWASAFMNHTGSMSEVVDATGVVSEPSEKSSERYRCAMKFCKSDSLQFHIVKNLLGKKDNSISASQYPLQQLHCSQWHSEWSLKASTLRRYYFQCESCHFCFVASPPSFCLEVLVKVLLGSEIHNVSLCRTWGCGGSVSEAADTKQRRGPSAVHC